MEKHNKISKDIEDKVIELRRSTRFNLALIAEKLGIGRASVQHICESHGLGNIGLRNKTKVNPSKPPKITSASLSCADAALRFKMRVYKCSAKKRGLDFDLTTDQCDELFSKSCYYCGSFPEPTKSYVRQRDGHPVAQNGIDRKDNNLGYNIKNCVSCCIICNYAKRDLELSKFETWLDTVAKFRTKLKEL